jgi:alkaline phosphatase
VHGEPGKRTDGGDLLEEARGLGYTVIFTRAELLNLPADTVKVLGVFAAVDTYDDRNEAALAADGSTPYDPHAPTYAEMVAKAIEILSHDPGRSFFLVAEEEGTDNFSNAMNAAGMLEAVMRADDGVGAAMKFLETPAGQRTLLLTASDSDAGHPAVWSPYLAQPDAPLPPMTLSGAALDGREGSGGPPFLSKPDARGEVYPFGISWGYSVDMPGSVVTRAHGFGADELKSTVDNTGLYNLMHRILFADSAP